MIVDNDHCGAFGFQHESREISEAAEEVQLKVNKVLLIKHFDETSNLSVSNVSSEASGSGD